MKPTNAQIRAVVAEALAAVALEPCGDNSCNFGPPGGMGTNGGCRCFGLRSWDWPQDPRAAADQARVKLALLARVVRSLAERLVADEADLVEQLAEWLLRHREARRYGDPAGVLWELANQLRSGA